MKSNWIMPNNLQKKWLRDPNCRHLQLKNTRLRMMIDYYKLLIKCAKNLVIKRNQCLMLSLSKLVWYSKLNLILRAKMSIKIAISWTTMNSKQAIKKYAPPRKSFNWMPDWSLTWWIPSTGPFKTRQLYSASLKTTKNIWEIKEVLWSTKLTINSNKDYNQCLISKSMSKMPEKLQQMHSLKRNHY